MWEQARLVALDRVPFERITEGESASASAYTAYLQARCALWTAQDYGNAEEICEDAAARETTATTPDTTTPDTSTPVYSESDVAELMRRHCRVSAAYNYGWLPTLTYRQGVWRVTWDNTYESGGPGTVTFTEATAQITVIDGCWNTR